MSTLTQVSLRTIGRRSRRLYRHNELSLRAFGRMSTVYADWGMRARGPDCRGAELSSMIFASAHSTVAALPSHVMRT